MRLHDTRSRLCTYIYACGPQHYSISTGIRHLKNLKQVWVHPKRWPILTVVQILVGGQLADLRSTASAAVRMSRKSTSFGISPALNIAQHACVQRSRPNGRCPAPSWVTWRESSQVRIERNRGSSAECSRLEPAGPWQPAALL